MLTQERSRTSLEAGQFRAFGYLILRQCLSPAEVARLQKAHDRVLDEAPRYDYFDDYGTRVLSPCTDADQSFAALIEHPRVLEAMRDIWGRECLYVGGGSAWSNRSDTPWHTDYGPGRTTPGIRTAIYLDEQSEGQGALNVIPGSHHPEFNVAIFRACGRWEKGGRPRLKFPDDAVPGAISLDTNPGDVVLWDGRIWHSAWRRADGRPRRTMFIPYVPDPGDDLIGLSDLKYFRQETEKKSPYIYTRAMASTDSPTRARMVARLEELGVPGVREP